MRKEGGDDEEEKGDRAFTIKGESIEEWRRDSAWKVKKLDLCRNDSNRPHFKVTALHDFSRSPSPFYFFYFLSMKFFPPPQKEVLLVIH